MDDIAIKQRWRPFPVVTWALFGLSLLIGTAGAVLRQAPG